MKAVDPARRPVGIVLNQNPNSDKSAKFFDIVRINKYWGWYEDTGHLEVVAKKMANLIDS